MTNSREINKTSILIATMASHFFNPFMGAAVNVALKKIGAEFLMSAVGLSWVSMSYLLSSAIFLVPLGKAGDIWGRTKIFFYGNIFFSIITFLTGLVTDGHVFIVMRFIQGIAAAMMVSTNMALVISAFPAHERGRVIGLNVSAVYLGLSLSPVLGGLLTDFFSWRSIFYLNAAANLFLSALIFLKIRTEFVAPTAEKFDWNGSLLYIFSVSFLMYGFSKLPLVYAIGLTLLGAAGLLLFIKMQIKSTAPVLDIKMFSENKIFAFANLAALINYSATFAVSFVLSLYLQYGKNMSAGSTGLVLIVQPIFMAAAASLSGRLSDKKNPQHLSALGMAGSALGLLMLIFLQQQTSLLYIISALIILGTGIGLFSSPNTNIVMSAVDKKVYGSASAVLATMRSGGMIFSMAVAALVIHVLLGDAAITAENISTFIVCGKIIFVVFTVLSFAGIFTAFVKETN